jgi:hypothetical protein
LSEDLCEIYCDPPHHHHQKWIGSISSTLFKILQKMGKFKRTLLLMGTTPTIFLGFGGQHGHGNQLG